MIHLEPVTVDNYRECLRLKVADSQSRLVASNAKSLAEAYVFYHSSRPFVIYADEEMVGFLLIRELADLQCYYLSQFMIDERYQRKGHGKQAMLILIDMLKKEKKYAKIDLCYVEGSQAARQLYEGLGFVPTGEVDGNEVLMQMILG